MFKSQVGPLYTFIYTLSAIAQWEMFYPNCVLSSLAYVTIA